MGTVPMRVQRRARWTVTAGVALISLGLLAFTASATFTASVGPTHATSAGDMTFTFGSAGDNHSIGLGSTAIVPGDTITRTIQIDVDNPNDTTITGVTLTTDCNASCTGSQTFVTDTSLGLKLWIERCSQAYDVSPTWDGSSIPTSVTCDTADGATATDVLGTSASPVNFIQTDTSIGSNLDLTDNATNYVKVRITWPEGSEGAHNAMKAQSATLRLTFTGQQRSGADK